VAGIENQLKRISGRERLKGQNVPSKTRTKWRSSQAEELGLAQSTIRPEIRKLEEMGGTAELPKSTFLEAREEDHPQKFLGCFFVTQAKTGGRYMTCG